ncbi:gephyrin-like molybdotransferase Glp [Falsirhodobacter sp. alg1]|uniref:molybdopterin molybdotransferase MoeA n=1 Tax=Falsirhodobacter sp. alg1 TaxID=1472418 RepID=UPI0005EDF2A6|nr:gephyrin-like molybdotransferase Glp [Falsirhodobacter sp. alg1]
MIAVEDAQKRVLSLATPIGTEFVPLADASGRVLARPVSARRAQPPFNASAMDGYATCGEAAVGTTLTLIGESRAGHGFDGTLGPHEAIRISTGAPVPDSATHVVMQENTRRSGDRITITEPSRGTNIRLRGQDFAAGQSIGPRRLRPADLALLAAMDVADVPVFCRPRVALISTGDELAVPGTPMRDDQIPSSNAFALKALIEEAGGIARILPIATDNAEDIRAVFELAENADIVVTIGGASVGDHDLIGPMAAELGLTLDFHKIAMRPGKPLMAGRIGARPMLGLPGNPVSAFVCAQLFLLPLIRSMTGLPPISSPLYARVAQTVPANGARTHYMRAHLADGKLTAFSEQDSSLMLRLTEANALLIRPIDAPALAKGDLAPFLPI